MAPGGTAESHQPLVKYALLLGAAALLALAIGLVSHHPIPPPLPEGDHVQFGGQSLRLPLEVRYVDGLADGGTMIFGAKDADGKIYGVVCAYGPRSARFQTLAFCPGLPDFDGSTPPALTPIIVNEPAVRNLVYHSMAAAGFHHSSTEAAMAQQLYPSLLERCLEWIR